MSSIPINNNPPYFQYTAAGGQTVFNYNFPIFSAADIAVYQRTAGSVPNDALDLLDLNVDYTVTGVGAANGGTVVLNVGATLSDIVTGIRNMNEDRLNQYTTVADLTADALNVDFERIVMMNQQNQYRVRNLAPNYPTNAVLAAKDLMLPQLGASQSWRMNAANTSLEAYSTNSNLIPWVFTNAANTVMAANTGYLVDCTAGVRTLTLPAIVFQGQVFEVVDVSPGATSGWKIAQNAGQQIQVLNILTTPGVVGSVKSVIVGSSIRLVVPNTARLICLSNLGGNAFVYT